LAMGNSRIDSGSNAAAFLFTFCPENMAEKNLMMFKNDEFFRKIRIDIMAVKVITLQKGMEK
jgi:hypothetical protein